VWRLMRDELLRSTKLFVDETTAPVLEPWCGRTPPAVVYSYAPGRSGEHAAALLQGYSGVRQTDGYAAYRSLAEQAFADGSPNPGLAHNTFDALQDRLISDSLGVGNPVFNDWPGCRRKFWRSSRDCLWWHSCRAQYNGVR
jgi:hypothetical protein